MRLLHITPYDTSGFSLQLVKAERKLGFDSSLLIFKNTNNTPGYDICLDLPFLNEKATKVFSKRYMLRKRPVSHGDYSDPKTKFWTPSSFLETAYFRFRDIIWEKHIDKTGFDVTGYDIYYLDRGLGFLRSGKIIRRIKEQGGRIVSIYQGSDLRLRGILPLIDELSDLNFTCEYDLLKIYDKLNYLFLPFDVSEYEVTERNNDRLKICHAPTNRAFKGSEFIIDCVKELERDYKVDLILLENMRHEDVIRVKSGCDIMIDQLGDLGYGYNSLESMAMGIPTCTEITPEYEEFIPDHPFININKFNLREKIIELVDNESLRKRKGEEGRKWIMTYHNSINVVRSMLDKYRECGWKID